MLHTVEILIKNVTPFELYSKFNNLKKCKSNCYSGTYKNISFKYYFNSSVLLLKINVLELMKTDKVCISDLTEFKKKCQQIVYEMINRKYAALNVNRIDYFIDLHLTEKEIEILENDLLYKHLHKYKYMSIKNIYKHSLAVRTRYGQRNLSVYNKGKERLDNGDITGFEKYNNVYRIESQIKKRLLKKEIKVNGISQDIENWWCKSACIENYIELFQHYLYFGDYWRIDKARQLIHNSNLKEIKKNRLCIFLTKINKVGMSEIKNYYSYKTIKDYIKLLDSLNINPLTINIDSEITYMKSIFKRIKYVAEKEYFK